MATAAPPIRGFLLHVTHYDPMWLLAKDREAKFDLDSGLEIVGAMADAGMNLLVVDCADGVAYRRHPELRRKYTVSMGDVRALASAARSRGIEVVPKLNFSKSGRNFHDYFMRPHWDNVSWLDKADEYWSVAGDLIDELVEACRPKRFFHVGMDEDHYRSLAQYVDAIGILRSKLKRRGLRTVVWNDSCHDHKDAVAQVHAEKCRAAEDFLPRDVVHVLWDYERVHASVVRRIATKGFDIWAAPGANVDSIRGWRKAVLREGGRGLLMTSWIKCDRTRRARLVKLIRALGPEYSGAGAER